VNSIYQIAMGADFAQLHPKIQERFGFSSANQMAAIGTGVMDRVWHGALYTLPFLYMGTWRRIMFPEHGKKIPFTIENYAYLDSRGRETVTWLRTFQTRRTRRFDAYMIYSQRRQKIIDYLGTHQHLAVDIDLAVDPTTRGLRLRSGAQRFYEGPIAFQFPMFFSGIADVCEWYDEATQRYRIKVEVTNKVWGPLFGYEGSFTVDWRPMASSKMPAHAMPRREEPRE